MSHVPTGRDNGLPVAASYVALVDVDPPVADHVLSLLRDAGVPAVAEPLAGQRGPYQDVQPPPRPTERVHVDGGRSALARELVGRALPALRADFHADAARRADAAVMQAADVEREFAAIVLAYDEPHGPVGPWPALEDRDPDPEGDAPGDLLESEPPARPGLSARLVRRGGEAVDEEPDPSYWPEDHFVPPVPPRPPRMGRVSRFAWAGVIGGPLVLLVIVVANLRVEPIVMVAALAAFMAGFVTLVVRMPDKDDDDWDDGAVV